MSLMRVDCDEHPNVVDMYFRDVDWPLLSREEESVDLGVKVAVSVEGVGHDVEGRPNVILGRHVLTDLQAVLIRKAGWRVEVLSPEPLHREEPD